MELGSDGRVRVQKRLSDEWTDLTSPTLVAGWDSAVDPDQPHTLTGNCDTMPNGDVHPYLSVNGIRAVESIDNTAQLAAGDIGLIVSTESEGQTIAHFDDVVLWED